jgi:ArsR family transcriptional regulator
MLDAEFTKVAKALSDPTRRQILEHLKVTPNQNCTQLCGHFTLAQPTISHHLKTLETAGLITMKREGQFNIVAIRIEQLAKFAAACYTR